MLGSRKKSPLRATKKKKALSAPAKSKKNGRNKKTKYNDTVSNNKSYLGDVIQHLVTYHHTVYEHPHFL